MIDFRQSAPYPELKLLAEVVSEPNARSPDAARSPAFVPAAVVNVVA